MSLNTRIYTQLADETARRVTENGEEWKSFLKTSARLYKYPYEDQLMIYAQKPGATACAEYDTWNDAMHRYVKRGSKGIGLVDYSRDRPRMRYVFDVSDTGERWDSRSVSLFSMKPEYREVIEAHLADAYSLERMSLEAMIGKASTELAKEYWEDQETDLRSMTRGGFPVRADDGEIGRSFRRAAAASTAYGVMSRCTEEPDQYFRGDAFQEITFFHNRRGANALGSAVSRMTEEIFSGIVRAVREYEKEKRREQQIRGEQGEVQREEEVPENSIFKQEKGITESAMGKEREKDERTGVHTERRLSDPGDQAGGAGEATHEMGKDVQGIPAGQPSGYIQRTGADREALSAPSGDTGNGAVTDGTDDERVDGESTASGQENRSDGVGPPYERTKSTGRGDRDSGAYKQLTLDLLFPTELQQIEKLEKESPIIMEVPEAEFDRILQSGTGFQGGKLRVQAFFVQETEGKSRADFLKQEYGIGGRSWDLPNEPRGAFVDFDAKGITVWRFFDHAEVRFRWPQAADRIAALISENRYLNEKEKEEYRKLSEQIKDEEHKQEEIKPAGIRAGDTEVLTDTVEPALETEPEPVYEHRPAQNFHITDFHLGEGGPKEKYRANVEVIRLLRTLEEENRHATPQEQEILSRYVGWGSLPEVFDEKKEAWSSEYTELKGLLDSDEYERARASTLNAHYTSPTVIKAIYDTLDRFGFRSGNILEPSCGVGNFFGMLPANMQESRLYGVELDPISGRIAQELYPKAYISITGFEKTDRRDFYDIAVGNVPFGQYKVNDRAYNKLGFSIHNYFFAKALDQVRPGGIVAFVTSHYTMDAKSPEVRKYLAQRAELLGAVRLPDNAFRANAGTDVVSDILFLQKRDRVVDIEPDWVHLGQTEDGFAVNSYFLDHPEMVLGTFKARSSQFGRDELTVKPLDGADLGEQLKEALSRIAGVYTPASVEREEGVAPAHEIPADPMVKNFSYTEVDGEVYFRENSMMSQVNLTDGTKERMLGLIRLRGIVSDLIDLQMEDRPDEDIHAKQAELNTAYDSFTKKFGLINGRGNARAFEEDSSYYLLCSLENIDEDGNLVSKADMFTKRTIRPDRSLTHVDTPSEALAVSIGERGAVDMGFMSSLLGTPGEYGRIIEELKGVIFKDPLSGKLQDRGWQTADEYLSGNVREKLKIAQEAASENSVYQINVEALEKAQPKDLEASEIDVRLGATWVDAEYIDQFMYEIFGTAEYLKQHIGVKFVPYTAGWQISNKNMHGAGNVSARVTYGTDRMNAYEILEDTLNLKDVRVYDYVEDAEGKKKRILNNKETTLAAQKQTAIKNAFRDWIWSDAGRRNTLVKKYNELFNSVRPREYDGRHIRFVGMSPDIELREHQLNAVAHVLYGGNTLLAHEVGAGKTFEMAASAMESKRLGLCTKSMFVVPNHLTLQWASEFLRLYPSAKILVATRKDFEKARRRKFCARIATGDYDAVIIGHSQFERIPISPERQRRLIERQIDEIEEFITELKLDKGERFTIKEMEKTRKSLEARLEKLSGEEKKDDVVYFEQLGIDRLFVDESQSFKNLFLYTKMRNVAGLSTSEAQKSTDMFLKCRYMDEVTGGRGTVFATGTPVSNSMTELYTVMRYLQYGTLERLGLTQFDAWASTFGETTTSIELAPEGTGYRARTRFAKFFNLPELMNIFKEVADIKTSDQLDLKVPKVRNETVLVHPSDIQKEMVQALSERAARVHTGSVDPSEDNMLKITSDGRKIGLDQRLMNPLLADDPGSKLNACVENVFRIWEEGKEKKLTQLLFCDMSTPKNDGSFNVYDDIREKLEAKGIPETEIAFIHEADTENKKKELFSKVRSGQVRVLLGSTQKMGAGTNVQDRLIAVHHLDVGWRPSDMTQRNGRIIRQGNMNPEVQIYQYVTEGTFDAYLYQTLENKQKFISQIMTSKSPVRACDDVDEQVLSYAEVKALCAGNPLIREKMDLDIEVARLRVLKSDHQNKHYRMEDMLLKQFPARIENQKGIIERQERDLETAVSHPVSKEDFPGMVIDGIRHGSREEAGEAILARCKFHAGEQEIGHYRGFSMELSYNAFTAGFQLKLRGAYSYDITLGQDARGNITRIDNAIAHIEKDLERSRQMLTELYAQKEQTKDELAKPFPQQEELVQKEARLAELDAELNMDRGNDEEQRAMKSREKESEREEMGEEMGNSETIDPPKSMDTTGLKKALMMPAGLREQRTENALRDLLTVANSVGDDRISQMIRDGMRQGLSAVEQARRILMDCEEGRDSMGNTRIIYFQSPGQMPEVAEGAVYR